jgi:hypothetical protein
LLDSVRRGELDRVAIPHQPLDVVAQQIVAEVAAQDWPQAALYQMVRGAWHAPISTPSCKCWLTVLPHAAAGAARLFIATPFIKCCAPGGEREPPR